MNKNKILLRYFIIVIAIVGFVAFLGEFQNKNKTGEEAVKIEKGKNFFEVNNFLGGKKLSINYQDFKGGEVSCFMGGSEIHLEDAKINGEATIEFSVMMGGAQIYVPADWNVVNNITSIMGGVEVSGEDTKTDPNKTLILEGSALMGGVEITRI